MHTTSTAQQRKGARGIGDRADHFELLDIETFQVLPDPGGIRPDSARTMTATGQARPDLR
ncbi:hypothetical protein D3C71_1831350 [compost metagenome]